MSSHFLIIYNNYKSINLNLHKVMLYLMAEYFEFNLWVDKFLNLLKNSEIFDRKSKTNQKN